MTRRKFLAALLAVVAAPAVTSKVIHLHSARDLTITLPPPVPGQTIVIPRRTMMARVRITQEMMDTLSDKVNYRVPLSDFLQ